MKDKFYDDIKTEQLIEKIEELFAESTESVQRQAIYKTLLETWEMVEHVQRALYRIENTQMMLNRQNIMMQKESELKVV